ncbi:hypothetical protein PNOK_0731700 [Pyrrhoderma noxium]|uniref:SP-RING-type domain-containing protein n=1 Tax=Pyrrhoderma noxium TaxID=2282107 RepID=A0A286UCC8_9AGAM|nr:hypothetical protein PNOK_0731700 [Pyrrhoderma noxium]
MARGRTSRIRRRQDSEDQIEEEENNNNTQRSRTEDVEEEEEEETQSSSKRTQRRTIASNGVSQKKKGSKMGQRKSDDEENSDSSDDDDSDEKPLIIDVQNFGDQPLAESDSRRLASLSEDWKQIIRYNQEIALDAVREIAVAMAEASEDRDGDVAKKELDKSDAIMRELLDLQHELKSHNECIVELSNEIARGEEINNVVERYKSGVEDRISTWNSKTARQKYAKDEFYIKFRQDIYEVHHPDEGMPPLTELMSREEGDDDDEDEDIEIGGVTQSYTCPLTLTILTNPLTSSLCQHSFSAEAIREYLGQNPSVKKKCPAAGCNQKLNLNDFKPDKELEKRIKLHIRREQRRQAEAESGAEDVDEIID